MELGSWTGRCYRRRRATPLAATGRRAGTGGAAAPSARLSSASFGELSTASQGALNRARLNLSAARPP